jgi:hypothetical protein
MTFQPKLIAKPIDNTKVSPMSRGRPQIDEDPYLQKQSNIKHTPSGTNIVEGSLVISRIDASSNFGSSNQVSHHGLSTQRLENSHGKSDEQ